MKISQNFFQILFLWGFFWVEYLPGWFFSELNTCSCGGFLSHGNRYVRVPFSGFPDYFGLPLSDFINNISEIADWYYNVRTLFYTYDNFYSPFNLWVLDHYWPHELRFWLGVFPPVTKKKTKSFVVFLLVTVAVAVV